MRWVNPLLPRVHINELGIFIQNLMSRAFEHTIINILFFIGHFHVVANFKIKGWEQNLRKSNGCKVEVVKLGQLMILFGN
jgi:hypothetical protein